MKLVRAFLFLFTLSLLAVAARAQESSYRFTSDPGDPIAGGGSGFLIAPGVNVYISINSDNSIKLIVNDPNTNSPWVFGFAAPNQQLLQTGTYDLTALTPAVSQPGLNVSHSAGFCISSATGSFVVKEIVYDNVNFPSSVVSFDATFEQHCDDLTPGLRGEVRFNAHPLVTISAPAQISVNIGRNLSFTVTATDAQSRHVVLSLANDPRDVPPGVSFTDNGDNTGTFTWAPPINFTGQFPMIFQGDNQAGDLGARMTLVNAVPPTAPNDDFDQATVISSLPFTVTQDVGAATMAPDDPVCFNDTQQSVWFAFTPTRNMELEANTFGSSYDTALAAYTGTRGALTQIACDDNSGGSLQSRIRFAATAGTTYYFVVTALFNDPRDNLQFTLFEPPPPLTLSLEVSPFGIVNHPDGTVTISGVLTCSVPVLVSMFGTGEQDHGVFANIGFMDPDLDCNGRTPWTAHLGVGSTTSPSQSPQFHVGML
ncbi:MAG TPA: hypothetical protein VIJ01_05385, partial [Candidatus Angelobacter sp.]